MQAAIQKQKAEEAARRRRQAAIQAQNRSSGFPQERFSGAKRERGLRPNQREEGGWGRLVEGAGDFLRSPFGGPRTDAPRTGPGWTYSGMQRGSDPQGPTRQARPVSPPVPTPVRTPPVRTPPVVTPAPTGDPRLPLPANMRGKAGMYLEQGAEVPPGFNASERLRRPGKQAWQPGRETTAPLPERVNGFRGKQAMGRREPVAPVAPVAPVFPGAQVPSFVETEEPANRIPAGLSSQMRRHAGFREEPSARMNPQAALLSSLVPGPQRGSSTERLRSLVQALSEYRRGGRVRRR